MPVELPENFSGDYRGVFRRLALWRIRKHRGVRKLLARRGWVGVFATNATLEASGLDGYAIDDVWGLARERRIRDAARVYVFEVPETPGGVFLVDELRRSRGREIWIFWNTLMEWAWFKGIRHGGLHSGMDGVDFWGRFSG